MRTAGRDAGDDEGQDIAEPAFADGDGGPDQQEGTEDEHHPDGSAEGGGKAHRARQRIFQNAEASFGGGRVPDQQEAGETGDERGDGVWRPKRGEDEPGELLIPPFDAGQDHPEDAGGVEYQEKEGREDIEAGDGEEQDGGAQAAALDGDALREKRRR